MPTPTLAQENRVFYFDVGYVQYDDAAPFFKILAESGAEKCMAGLIEKFKFRTEPHNYTVLNIRTSCGTEDKLFESEKLAMAYNEELGYFHIMGRKIHKEYYWCANCGNVRTGSDLKWYDFIDGMICRKCFGEKFDSL